MTWPMHLKVRTLPVFFSWVGPLSIGADALRQQLSALNQIDSLLFKQLVLILSRRACDALLPVRSIPSQFRAMSSKRIPTEPSYFLPLILQPVKTFFETGIGERLRRSLLRDAATEVFDSVCQKYVLSFSIG